VNGSIITQGRIYTYAGTVSASTTPVTVIDMGTTFSGLFIATARRSATDSTNAMAIVAVNTGGSSLTVTNLVSSGWAFSGSGTNLQLQRSGGGAVTAAWAIQALA